MQKKNYPKWLVPIEIAKKLKKIGFNTNTLFLYNEEDGPKVMFGLNTLEEVDGQSNLEIEQLYFYQEADMEVYECILPTWEQVFEWFRSKVNLSYSITHKVYYRRKREELAFGVTFPVDEDRVGWTYEFKSDLPCEINFNLFDKSRLFNTYEESRLELVKLLIKLYEKKK